MQEGGLKKWTYRTWCWIFYIRHTGVGVYGKEYFFGGGIQCVPAGRTPFGTPVQVTELGYTQIPKEIFEEYLRELGPRYTMQTYSLLHHNCNHFSDEVAQFLVGTGIPQHILRLPEEAMNSPLGTFLCKPFRPNPVFEMYNRWFDSRRTSGNRMGVRVSIVRRLICKN